MSRPRSPEEWYVSIAPLLRTIATRKFRVPRDDADALVHDVFISFLRRRDIDDVRAWFIGAISHACRDYWRKQGRIVTGEAMEERMFEPAEIERVRAHEVLRALTPREQRVLWLRFAEGFTVKEVAHAIGRSVSRTEKLLRRARLRAVAVIAADEEESAHRWTKRWRCARNRHFSAPRQTIARGVHVTVTMRSPRRSFTRRAAGRSNSCRTAANVSSAAGRSSMATITSPFCTPASVAGESSRTSSITNVL